MGKQTIFINPDPDFVRTNIHTGTPLVKSSKEFLNAINSFYSSKGIPGFHSPELKRNRENIFYETIGFTDGMNHIRAGYYFSKVLESIEPGEGAKRKIHWSFRHWFRFFLLMTGKFFFVRRLFLKLPKFKKTIWMFEKWRLQNMEKLKNEYKGFMKDFYKNNQIEERLKDGSLYKDLGLK